MAATKPAGPCDCSVHAPLCGVRGGVSACGRRAIVVHVDLGDALHGLVDVVRQICGRFAHDGAFRVSQRSNARDGHGLPRLASRHERLPVTDNDFGIEACRPASGSRSTTRCSALRPPGFPGRQPKVVGIPAQDESQARRGTLAPQTHFRVIASAVPRLRERPHSVPRWRLPQLPQLGIGGTYSAATVSGRPARSNRSTSAECWLHSASGRRSPNFL